MGRMSEDGENRLSVELFGRDVQGVYDRFTKAVESAPPGRDGSFPVPASDKQKTFLRSLLARHAGTEAAEATRDYCNVRRLISEPISRDDASAAIHVLKNLTEDNA